MSEEPTRDMPAEVMINEHSSIRLLRADDAERIHEMLEADPDIRSHIGWIDGADTVEELRERIVAVNQRSSYRYGIIDDGVVVGYVGLWPSQKSDQSQQYDIGYFLDKPARGRGLASRAVNVLTEVAGKSIDVDSFALFIRDANTESQGLAKRLGFAATDFMFVDKQGEKERRYVKAAETDKGRE